MGVLGVRSLPPLASLLVVSKRTGGAIAPFQENTDSFVLALGAVRRKTNQVKLGKLIKKHEFLINV
jgi:hypothetical protein